jgi:hypothetical protein
MALGPTTRARSRAATDSMSSPASSEFLSQQESLSYQGASRWRSADGERIYTWDHTHGEIEVFNKRGKHLGAADPQTGVLIKPPRKGRTIDV